MWLHLRVTKVTSTWPALIIAGDTQGACGLEIKGYRVQLGGVKRLTTGHRDMSAQTLHLNNIFFALVKSDFKTPRIFPNDAKIRGHKRFISLWSFRQRNIESM
ncbi:hypothetical protein PoB_007080000 [Plakobranchus ocellatus]|uniref:Uncharacterized protein n=1 Tax=Plakobranchus ocellatus TaxID=259542 RepID=A0AAV4DJV5_9GAST|nr:hypothetical protein PoB_007080000 [Plakobranchus ocellatus]